MAEKTLRELIDELAPQRASDPASALALADAVFALSGGLSTWNGHALPAERDELRAHALATLQLWVPKLDGNVLEQLRWRVEDRKTPIDLAPRIAELAAARKQDRARAIAASTPPPTAHVELYRMIDRDPDDASAYRMLADALIDAGDPRGELIAMQTPDADAATRAAAKQHFEAHRDVLLGPLAEYLPAHDDTWHTRLDWRHGFIRSAKLALYDMGDPAGWGKLAELLELLLAHPSGRFLVEISFGISGAPGERANLTDVIAMLAERAPATLRTVHLGDFDYPRETDISSFEVGDVSPLWSLAQLRTVIVQGGWFELGTIDAPALEHLEVRTGSLKSEHARAIATARLPAVRDLEVWFGDENYQATATLDDIVPLLERSDVPALAHLGLRNTEFTDALCRVVAGTPLLAHVRTLDLSMGCMTDDGARALATCTAELAHLERIDVSDNFLTADGIAALAPFGSRVVVGAQKPDDEDQRYVSVGE